jgi:uncharacterized membrane protein YhaH (DUF805 family)
MGFGQAISTCISKYVDFNGRARRSEYWFWQLFKCLVFGALLTLLAVGIGLSGNSDSPNVIVIIAGILLVLAVLGFFLPDLAVLVRRLHDVNSSGWLILITIIPIIGIIGAIVLFVMTIMPGTVGPNTYGPESRV